jgi:hypothetical protein|nr:MAG TPA: hypothetical protein [Caudoviricetes sp.]
MSDITIGLQSQEKVVLNYDEGNDKFSVAVEDNYDSTMSVELTEEELNMVKGCIQAILERK